MDEGNNFGRNFENGAKCRLFLRRKKNVLATICNNFGLL